MTPLGWTLTIIGILIALIAAYRLGRNVERHTGPSARMFIAAYKAAKPGRPVSLEIQHTEHGLKVIPHDHAPGTPCGDNQ